MLKSERAWNNLARKGAIMGLAIRQWIFLWSFYVIYLLFGACIFYHIEHGAETVRRVKELEDRIEINGMYWRPI